MPQMETKDALVLRGYPVHLGAWQQQHMDGLEREFALLNIGHEAGLETSAPLRLQQLACALRAKHAAELDKAEQDREDALERGEAQTDIYYPIVENVEEILTSWREIMRDVDEYCANGDLLSLTTPPLLVQFREWSVNQLLGQLRGEEPEPWTGPLTRDGADS